MESFGGFWLELLEAVGMMPASRINSQREKWPRTLTVVANMAPIINLVIAF